MGLKKCIVSSEGKLKIVTVQSNVRPANYLADLPDHLGEDDLKYMRVENGKVKIDFVGIAESRKRNSSETKQWNNQTVAERIKGAFKGG